jgi:hypothetical protein
MAEIDFILLWKEQYAQLDQSLQINRLLLKEMIQQKANRAIQSLKWFKVVGIGICLLYLLLLGILLNYAIAHYTPNANYFIISISALFLINIKAFFDYVRHLIWAAAINFDGAVTDIQDKLLQLQFSLFRHNRFMFLQLPFWTTFYLSSQWFPHSVGAGFIIFQLLFTGSFCWLAVWLYLNHTPANAHKKWVQVFMRGSGGKNIQAALGFFQEMEQFKLNQ